MRVAWYCVLLCIVQCIQTCRIAKKKSPKVASTSWMLPPDNEDWYGFENLLLTSDLSTTTLSPHATTESDVANEKDFPWPGLSPGDTVFDPPKQAQIKRFIGQSMACFLPLDKGKGDLPAIRWHYNFTTDRCVPFLYKGYPGNVNRWLTKYHCHVNCRLPPKPCCVPETLFNYEKFLKNTYEITTVWALWG